MKVERVLSFSFQNEPVLVRFIHGVIDPVSIGQSKSKKVPSDADRDGMGSTGATLNLMPQDMAAVPFWARLGAKALVKSIFLIAIVFGIVFDCSLPVLAKKHLDHIVAESGEVKTVSSNSKGRIEVASLAGTTITKEGKLAAVVAFRSAGKSIRSKARLDTDAVEKTFTDGVVPNTDRCSSQYNAGMPDPGEASAIVLTASRETSGSDSVLQLEAMISGNVYQPGGTVPISGAYVWAIDAATAESVAGDDTDETGLYSISAPSGSYKLWAEADGWVGQYYPGTQEFEQALTITVTAAEQRTGIDFILAGAGSITGHVYEDDGVTPLQGAEVLLWGFGTWNWVTSAPTLPDGSYTLSVASGTYRVQVYDVEGWQDQFYFNAAHWMQASPVVVSAPDETRGIDFVLARAGSITGHVYEDDAMTPMEGASVDAFQFGTWNWVASAETLPNGGYTLWVPSDVYMVAVYRGDGWVGQYYLDTLDWEQSSPVIVTAPDETSGVDFVLARAGRIAGHVYEDDGVTPVAGASVDVEDFETENWVAYTETLPDGSYMVWVPSGTYTVHVCDVEGRLEQYYFSTLDSEEALPVTVTAPDEISGIDFLLEQAATITGHVYQAGGMVPLGGAWVSALDPTTGEWVAGDDTDAEGFYSIAVPGGNFKVEVYADRWVGQYYPGTSEFGEASIVTVNVPEERSGIDVVLARAGSITGHVYEDDGVTPVRAAWIEVYEVGTWNWVADTQSLPNGSYGIWVPSGAFTVHVYNAEGWQEQYYLNTPYWEEASQVAVSAPGETGGIDFILDRAGSITGHVYENDGVTPVPRAEVEVYEFGTWNWVADTEVLSDGSYTIWVPSGTYTVHVYSIEGWQAQYYFGTPYWEEASPVAVSAPDETSGIDFILVRAGSITGHVYEDDGVTPAAGAWIDVYNFRTGNWIAGAETLADGGYSLWVMTGTYRVAVSGVERYLEQYYLNTLDWDEASPVVVSAPDETGGIDFALVRPGSITGHVYEDDGVTPVPGVWVDVEVFDTWNWVAGTQTLSDGSYTVLVPSGTYTVHVYEPEGWQEQYYLNTPNWHEASPVVVSAPDETRGIDFALVPAGRIAGHVYEDDGVTPVAGASVDVYKFGTENWVASTETLPSGSYTVSVPSGTYTVHVYDVEGWLDQYYFNVPVQEEASPVVVAAPEETSGIDFVLVPAGSITGHVYEDDGVTPVAGASVDVEEFETGNWITSAETLLDGSYTVWVPSGAYRVQVFGGEGWLGQYYPETFYWENASPVAVLTPEEISGIDFVLQRAGTISGYVYQTDGTVRLAGAWVEAINATTGDSVAGDDTDEAGFYSVAVPTGSYKVEACLDGWECQYYPGTPEFDEASTISVTAPEDRTGVDFALIEAPAALRDSLYMQAEVKKAERKHLDGCAPSGFYFPGGEYEMPIRIEYLGRLTVIAVEDTPPPGWAFVSVGGPSPPDVTPSAGDTGTMSFGWTTPPASPVSFTYTVHVPAAEQGDRDFSGGKVLYRGTGSGQVQRGIVLDAFTEHEITPLRMSVQQWSPHGVLSVLVLNQNDPSGSPSGSSITISPLVGTIANWTYSFLLPEGTYTVGASATNFSPEHRTAEITALSPTAEVFYLTPDPGSVSGRVTSTDSSANIRRAGVQLEVTSGSYLGRTYDALTDTDGRFSLSDLPAAVNYRITVSKNFHNTYQAPLTLSAGKAKDLGTISLDLADNDGDGLPDEWELHWFGHLREDGASDPDADGRTNRHEYLARTNPTSGSSCLRITSIVRNTSEMFTITWASAADKLYRIYYADTIGTWSLAVSNIPASGMGENSWTDSSTSSTVPQPAEATIRFYRVEAY